MQSFHCAFPILSERYLILIFCTTPDWSDEVFIRERVDFKRYDFHLLLIILCIQKVALTKFITYYKKQVIINDGCMKKCMNIYFP
jgi:hypothetical protein